MPFCGRLKRSLTSSRAFFPFMGLCVCACVCYPCMIAAPQRTLLHSIVIILSLCDSRAAIGFSLIWACLCVCVCNASGSRIFTGIINQICNMWMERLDGWLWVQAPKRRYPNGRINLSYANIVFRAQTKCSHKNSVCRFTMKAIILSLNSSKRTRYRPVCHPARTETYDRLP